MIYMTPYLLNLLDLVFTLYALSINLQELNPLMQHLPTMLFYKVVLVGVLCWWLSKRPERIARLGLQLCTIIYGCLCVYHIYGLFRIGVI